MQLVSLSASFQVRALVRVRARRAPVRIRPRKAPVKVKPGGLLGPVSNRFGGLGDGCSAETSPTFSNKAPEGSNKGNSPDGTPGALQS